MGRPFILYYDEIPSQDSIHCCICRTRIAFIKDYVPNVHDLLSGGYFHRVFNVEVPEDERYHQVVGGKTFADTYCVECGMPLGWKLIVVSQPSRYYREGRFYMRLDKLIYWNDVALYNFLFEDANGQAPDDQDGGADEQDHDQDVGANEQDHEQNGGAIEQNADQDVGDNEQNADQDIGVNE